MGREEGVRCRTCLSTRLRRRVSCHSKWGRAHEVASFGEVWCVLRRSGPGPGPRSGLGRCDRGPSATGGGVVLGGAGADGRWAVGRCGAAPTGGPEADVRAGRAGPRRQGSQADARQRAVRTGLDTGQRAAAGRVSRGAHGVRRRLRGAPRAGRTRHATPHCRCPRPQGAGPGGAGARSLRRHRGGPGGHDVSGPRRGQRRLTPVPGPCPGAQPERERPVRLRRPRPRGLFGGLGGPLLPFQGRSDQRRPTGGILHARTVPAGLRRNSRAGAHPTGPARDRPRRGGDRGAQREGDGPDERPRRSRAPGDRARPPRTESPRSGSQH